MAGLNLNLELRKSGREKFSPEFLSSKFKLIRNGKLERSSYPLDHSRRSRAAGLSLSNTGWKTRAPVPSGTLLLTINEKRIFQRSTDIPVWANDKPPRRPITAWVMKKHEKNGTVLRAGQ